MVLVKNFRFNDLQTLLGTNQKGEIAKLSSSSRFAYKEITGEIPSNLEFFESIAQKNRSFFKPTGSNNYYKIQSLLLYVGSQFECILSIKDQGINIFSASKKSFLENLNGLFTNFTIRGLLYEKTFSPNNKEFVDLYLKIKNSDNSLIIKQLITKDISGESVPQAPGAQPSKVEGCSIDNLSELGTTVSLDLNKTIDLELPIKELDKDSIILVPGEENKLGKSKIEEKVVPEEQKSPIKKQLDEDNNIVVPGEENKPNNRKLEEKVVLEKPKKLEVIKREENKLDNRKREENKKIVKPEAEKPMQQYEQNVEVEQNTDEVSLYVHKAFLSAYSKLNVELVYYDIKRRPNHTNTWLCCNPSCEFSNPKYMRKCIRCSRPKEVV